MSFVTSMDSVAVGQLLIDKSCYRDFNFTEEICDNLLEDAYEDENTQVENEVAQYKVLNMILTAFKVVLIQYTPHYGLE